MFSFSAKIQIIGVNPYVLLPSSVLEAVFEQAGKNKGPVQVEGTLNKKPYKQTLVKFAGKWRLYLNGEMRKAAGIDVGDMAHVEIEFDPVERTIDMHPMLEAALKKNKEASEAFERLSPSRKKEIVRYISFLKTEESVAKNIKRAMLFLTGKERFVGRDKP